MPEREQLFDDWADRYDAHVAQEKDFPFEGYTAVITEIVSRASVVAGDRILDLGVGTGVLAERFEQLGCEVWGLDFSNEMLVRARVKCPSGRFLKCDLLGEWPHTLPLEFDVVVSGYVFHEFNTEAKIRMLRRALRSLNPNGALIIGDIAFSSRAEREEAHRRWEKEWDEDEFYWAWDEVDQRLKALGCSCTFTKLSVCGGIVELRRSSE